MRLASGKYVVDRLLGRGGMAEVFLGRMVGAEGFSRPVAIKCVLPGFSENRDFAEAFVGEAKLTSRLQHPNIVTVIDFAKDDDGRLFLVMEWVNGTDLDGLLQTGPLPFSTVIHLALEILRGLDHAHDLPVSSDSVKGVIHRDISPHNVLLSWQGETKVSDFGIAKARAKTQATETLLVKGKPAYMSPEQARGQPLDGRSDLFAVGIMLYEALTAQPLFAGGSLEETLGRVWHAEIPDPRAVRPEIPIDLARVVTWLLQRDLNKRLPTAAAAIEALKACRDYPKDGREELVAILAHRFAGRAPIRARDVSQRVFASHQQVTIVAATATHTMTLPPPVRSRSTERRWRWTVIGSLLVIGTATSALVAITTNSRTDEPAAGEHSSGDGAAGLTRPHTSGVPEQGSAAPAAVLVEPNSHSAGPLDAGTVAPVAIGPTTPAPATATTAVEQKAAPTPPVPARRPARAAPKPEGIREIRLDQDR